MRRRQHSAAAPAHRHQNTHRIMGIEDSAGCLTSKEFKDLYMARVDCHLIHGCEVPPDSEDSHVKELEAIQLVSVDSCCFLVIYKLAATGKKCWAGDLVTAGNRKPALDLDKNSKTRPLGR
ncbi:hypothetical protein C8F04DRAFT_1179543 [Mycena alexandri]|uniref:Uncharacterized protein n=1 Tax=Mycena alexandri TaxID=1745969 RepID=A0AAD6T2J7_9AGAR|nr:hypothetical protein C8F04DRAFT_1179543 [Mycena alexandri]